MSTAATPTPRQGRRTSVVAAAEVRLIRFGFTEDQAWALARSDYDIRFVPFDDVRAVLLGGAQ